jgi:hypothetical protein
MYRKEVNAQSPLRILERSIHGGLGRGNLGVVLAPAGVGKSACLVQIGLDDLMREKAILHVAAGQTVEHVSTWYDVLFDDLADQAALADRDGVRESVGRHRVIRAFPEGGLTPERLDEALSQVERTLQLRPSAILVDGFDWAGPGSAAAVLAIKAAARRAGAELWMTAQTPRGYDVKGPRTLTPPCEPCDALIDVALFLEPHGSHVEVRLVKDFGDAPPADALLSLHADTLRLVKEGEAAAPVALPARSHTLLALGSAGAEAEFGACAERWGLSEINFTFGGRDGMARTRGLLELSEDELRLGEVSAAYLKAHMHRTYPDSPVVKHVLQAIWHQVSTAGEVFSVGTLKPDSTAQGGTGWAVELARHWKKPVHVFDQDRQRWFAWNGREWAEEAPPAVTRERFAGCGTRSLTEAGKEAIRALFERSFGKR